MDMSFSEEFSFISARASINQGGGGTMFFYSVPTSPTFKFKTSSLHGSDLDEDGFEFETSRRFLDSHDFGADQRKGDGDERRKSGDSLSSMAFADELFCDGKVLPLPLKLPPRLQNGSGGKKGTPSSAASLSPRSLGLSLRRTFSVKSLWNDDFDPFMVALKVVREEEKRGEPKGRDGIRRSKSELLMRSKGSDYGPYEMGCGGPKMVLSEPKGLEFARKARLIGLDKNGPNGPNGPNIGKEESESGGAWKKKRRRERIMEFLFGKGSGHYKLRDQKDEIVSKMKKMAVIFYKPRLLLCLGYGGRYVK